jgi:hypothetical protein
MTYSERDRALVETFRAEVSVDALRSFMNVGDYEEAEVAARRAIVALQGAVALIVASKERGTARG